MPLSSLTEWSRSLVLVLVPVLILVLICFKATQLLVHRRMLLQTLDPFPGPPSQWLLGHVSEFKQDGNDLNKLVEWGTQFPLAFPVWFGPSVVYLSIHHPDYVKTILASAEPKDDVIYRFLIPWIGDGLLVSRGQKWFRHRRLLTPGFHYNILKPYVKLMSDSANTMLDKWRGHASSSRSFELFQHVSLMTLDSIMKCAFSHDSNCQTESGTNSYIQAVYELSDLIEMRLRNFWYHSDIIFHLSPHGYRFRKACRVAHSHTEEVIRKRKEELKYERGLDAAQAKRNLDFLDILLSTRDEDQQDLSDDAVRAEVDTFMFKGHDTTASGISFALYSLACNPKHQKICREEVLQVLGDRDTMDWEDLNQIPYTTMCLKECLRLYTPVPGISRKLSKPMTFYDGRSVPAGCHIGISVFGIHRNATVWENPDAFDPLRFLPENVATRPPYAFMPFSAGPRNCIGQNFAMNEMKIVMALTLKRFHLIEDPLEKPKLIPRLVLRSLNGIHIKIRAVEPEETPPDDSL